MQNCKAEFKQEFQRRTYRFALDIIGFVEALPKGQVSHIIGDQLLRSATSVGANIVEAQAASSRKDYTNFFAYALKSANETKFWLSLLHDADKADQQAVAGLLQEADEIAKVLAASILTLRGRR